MRNRVARPDRIETGAGIHGPRKRAPNPASMPDANSAAPPLAQNPARGRTKIHRRNPGHPETCGAGTGGAGRRFLRRRKAPRKVQRSTSRRPGNLRCPRPAGRPGRRPAQETGRPGAGIFLRQNLRHLLSPAKRRFLRETCAQESSSPAHRKPAPNLSHAKLSVEPCAQDSPQEPGNLRRILRLFLRRSPQEVGGRSIPARGPRGGASGPTRLRKTAPQVPEAPNSWRKQT
jgi:hypothetical protein